MAKYTEEKVVDSLSVHYGLNAAFLKLFWIATTQVLYFITIRIRICIRKVGFYSISALCILPKEFVLHA